MSRRIVLGCLLAALSGLSAEAQTPFAGGLLPSRATLARVGLERQWLITVPLVGAERLLMVSVDQGMLFVQTNMANFYAYDAESGHLLWSAHLGRRLADARPASANSKLVFVTNANMLHALDRGTGRPVWVEDLHILPSSPTSCDEEHVLVGLSTGLLRGFDLRARDAKGIVKKDDEGHPILASRAGFAWNWQTNGSLTSRPLPAGRLVAFGGHDGKLYVALSDAPNPTMAYRIATGGPIEAPLGAYGSRTLLVASADKNVYAIDLFTADVIWTFSTGAPVLQEPIVADRDAYVMNTAGILNAVDVTTGQPRWSRPTHGGKLISVSGTRIYLESYDGDLFIVDRVTGQILVDPRSTYQRAGLDVRHFELGPTNSLNDRIYLGTRSGLIVCLREIGQLQPRPLRDPKVPPFGYIPPEGLDDKGTPGTPKEAAPKEENPVPAEEKTEAAGEKEMPKEEEAPK